MSGYDGGLGAFSLAELFSLEVEAQGAELTGGLLALEREPASPKRLEGLMRAAHSLKGAARIVGRKAAVRITHVMEDAFVAAQKGELEISRRHIDILLRGVDLLNRIAAVPEADIPEWDAAREPEIAAFLTLLASANEASPEVAANLHSATEHSVAEYSATEHPVAEHFVDEPEPGHFAANTPEVLTGVELDPAPEIPTPAAPAANGTHPLASPANKARRAAAPDAASRSLRITTDNLNRLMGLAGEIVVTSRWSGGFAGDLLRLKRSQQELDRSLGKLRESLLGVELPEPVREQLREIATRAARSQELLAARIADVDGFDRNFTSLSSRLYQEVLECRMRPFADGIHGFPRMVRDIARDLEKEVRFEFSGESTPVDRDILERIEAPLGHLLRNALDHGIESPAARALVGKPETGTIRLEAAHHSGMLLISVSDDGAGIDVEAIRETVVRKKLTSGPVAAEMTDAELLEFMFLPGFTVKANVTEISGRGVGLDAVQTMVREVGGTVRVNSRPGLGSQFTLQLPLTLSVMRTLLVEIAGEPYAFPLARIVRALKVRRNQVELLQGRQHIAFGNGRVGLVTAHQILGLPPCDSGDEDLCALILGDKSSYFCVVVDRFLKEQELVVRPLDPRLGKIQDISAAALLPDRSPVLIVDVEDMVRSTLNLLSGGSLARTERQAAVVTEASALRVLVVDDSLTVRELERKLLQSRGYEVEIAVDGMDGWNTVRAGSFDLLITDVDMPRMDGIELVTLIRKDNRLKSLPVMIVSYKDREEDQRRGLEAGADYYLTKGSFHDESLLQAVEDLIGTVPT